MKIVHIITRMIRGGAQENTLLSLIGQQEAGHEVILLTGPTSGPEGSLMPDVLAAVIRTIIVPKLIRQVNPLSDFAAYRELRSIIRDLQPDVVHTHSSKAGIIGRIAAWAERVPFVCHTIHGLPFHEYQSHLKNALYINCEKFAARHCHKIISVCDTMTEKAIAAGIGNESMYSTVYSGMRVDDFLSSHEQTRLEFRQRYNIDSDTLILGKVARLFELKGHDYILDAFTELSGKHPKAKLMFVGGGIWEDRLKEKAKRLGLEDKIIWTGLLHPQEVAGAIIAMDGLVHCSMREGLARVLPQALLCGKPVISFDIDGAKEVVINHKTGWLVPPEDIPALRTAMDKLLSDLPAANRLAQNGRELCRERFDYHTMNRQLIEIYQQGLDDRKEI